MSTKFTLLSKLSMKSVLGKIKIPDDGEVILAQIMGVATGIKTGESDKGPWTALLGSFQGINMETGSIYRSGVCFLPNIVMNLLLPKLLEKDSKAIEFAFNIGIKSDDKSATKYVYIAEPIFDTAENDPLEMLTKKLPKTEIASTKAIEHKKRA